MQLIDRLRQESIAARKLRSWEAAPLTTLLADVQKRAKDDGNRSPTDEDAVKVIQKTLGGLEETLSLLTKANRLAEATPVEEQILLLREFLPKEMSEEEMLGIVRKVIAELGATSPTDMGKVMGLLKANADATFNMKVASTLVRKELS